MVIIMGGWDFSIFWMAGQAVLHGQSPYTVANFFSPLLFAYGFIPLAVLAQQVAFFLWLFINLVILIVCLRRPFWKWLLYLPMLHLFSSGQVELLWWAMERGINRGWRGAILGAIMTLKPQAAIILLSWHLLDWLRHDRPTLARWLLLTGLLWGVPTLLNPAWIGEWRTNLPTSSWQESAGNAPGIFSHRAYSAYCVWRRVYGPCYLSLLPPSLYGVSFSPSLLLARLPCSLRLSVCSIRLWHW
jgi:hypothetical protein